MQIKKLEFYYFIEELKDFKKHKKILLDLISKMPNSDVNNNVESISKTDWNIPTEYNREYAKYFLNIITDYMSKLTDFLYVEEWQISNIWFQQYENKDKHNWHTHGHAHFTNVFYLELPDNNYKTEIFDFSDNILDIDVKEGDILTFPAFYNHRSKTNYSNKRKTIISFNSNFVDSNRNKISKALTNNTK